LAPTTEGTIETLRQLHPAAPLTIPPWVADFEPDESFQLDTAVLSRALSTAPSLSAGVPSGLLYEHYRDVLAEDYAAFAAFHVVCSLVARGQMPPRARAALSSCRLLAMAKPIEGQPDGVRSLAVGEVLHRLVARAVGLQLRDRFQQHFAPLQYGVATPGGCEAIVAGIRAYIEQEPQSLFLQVDLANAFNEVDRVAMFEELRDHFPELVAFVRGLSAASMQSLVGYCLDGIAEQWELLQSSTGSREGDPIAGHLFALPHRRALLATQAAFSDIQLPSLADDTRILGPPTPGTVSAFHCLQGELVKLNLRVKLAKCLAYSPAGIPPSLQLPPDFDRPAQGILAPGVPIGSAAHIHDVVGAKRQIIRAAAFDPSYAPTSTGSSSPPHQSVRVAAFLLDEDGYFRSRLPCAAR
jgi:AcrR family transcriptional regulator